MPRLQVRDVPVKKQTEHFAPTKNLSYFSTRTLEPMFYWYRFCLLLLLVTQQRKVVQENCRQHIFNLKPNSQIQVMRSSHFSSVHLFVELNSGIKENEKKVLAGCFLPGTSLTCIFIKYGMGFAKI